jgi:hypothetical protein
VTALLEGVKPETFITLTGIALILLYLIVGNFRGWYIPGPTHRREVAALESRVAQALRDRDEQVKAARLDRDKQVNEIRAEMTTRMDNFRADHAVRMDQVREDHVKQLAALVAAAEGIRADRDVMLAAKQRDADDWRAAYHIGAENAKASEDRMDAVLETERLSYAALSALLAALRDRDQLPPSVPQLPQLPPVGGRT